MINTDFPNSPSLILVVADKKTRRLLLRRALKKEGYHVAEAHSSEECLQACVEHKPDLVLLDANLSDMDGFSCCAQMQRLLGEDFPPVLMITPLKDQASIDRAFEVGAAEYITRPIHWTVLYQRVRGLLGRRRAMVQLKRQIEQEYLLKAQIEALEKKLQRLVSVDELTATANRRCFDEYLQREWKRLLREQKPLSLILCDIDFFKAYNDTYGHQAGDECIKQIANIIRQAVKRSADLVARYGGEEFAVILPNTPARGAVGLAETIRSQVKAQAISHAGSQVNKLVTLSLGVASVVPSSESSTDRLITEAKEALYHGKVGLGDRVVFNFGNLAVNTTYFNSSTPLIWEGNGLEFYETS
jgi:diguanylate cyclase (GGDEF)-like protein